MSFRLTTTNRVVSVKAGINTRILQMFSKNNLNNSITLFSEVFDMGGSSHNTLTMRQGDDQMIKCLSLDDLKELHHELGEIIGIAAMKASMIAVA